MPGSISRNPLPIAVRRPPPPPPPPPTTGGNLRLGASGPEVKALQQKLNGKGENLPVSGSFGPRTQEAVRRLQLANKIQPANGIVGPSTAATLAGQRGVDAFQAAPAKKAPVALSAPPPPRPPPPPAAPQGFLAGSLSAIKAGVVAVGYGAEAQLDKVAMAGTNALSARGAKADPNRVSSENKLHANGSNFSSTTRGEYSASAESIRDLIMNKSTAPDAKGNVGWARTWQGAAVEGLKNTSAGSEFSIFPLGRKTTLPVIGKQIDGPKVNIKLSNPIESKGPDGRREIKIPMTFTGDFTSARPGEITIKELPNGKRELKFNWPDAVPTGSIPDPAMAAIAHTKTLESAFFKQIEAALR